MMAGNAFTNSGGLYIYEACFAYAFAHLEKALFSAPDNLIFSIPVISEYAKPLSLDVSSILTLFTLERMTNMVITAIVCRAATIKAGTANAGANDPIWNT